MAMRPGLELKQSQQLVMTPQLQQAIKLLQMPSLDVAAFVAGEVERNPLLSFEEGGDPTTRQPAAGARESVAHRVASSGPGRANEGFDTGRENLFGGAERMGAAGEPAARAGLSAPAASSESADFTEWTAGAQTLRENLIEQLSFAKCSRSARTLATLFVDELDEAGYLRTDLDALANKLGAQGGVVAEALEVLQACDPPGIGARSLKECLALQLKRQDRFDPAMAALVDRLEDLASARYDRLAEACGVDEEDLADMVAELRRLDPRPAGGFGAETAQTVVPDILVRERDDGGWSVELNPDVMPRILIDRSYEAELARDGKPEAKDFLKQCVSNANWVMRLLDQRSQTIMKVATEIVRRQALFFSDGVQGLTPMTLRDVADVIGMHESTVSRVSANKRLSCPQGLFDLKFFFTQGLSRADGGDSISAEVVKDQIKALIANENPRRPLSDERIVTVLKQSGVNIARRTVAKYRDVMNIPSSSQRKRMKASALSRV